MQLTALYGVQEPCNWFLDFSQRKLVHVLLNQCFCGGRRIWGYLFHHLADITPKHLFYHFFCK